MRVLMVIVLCVTVLFCGCDKNNAPLDSAMQLRERILSSNGCSFQTTITADYGERIYTFTMDCQSDKNGNLDFTVVKPDTVAGIKGTISATGGNITFDDRVLAFQTLMEDQLTPVSAPWIFVKTLRSGYLKGCTSVNNGVQIYIDDTYFEDALQLIITTSEEQPSSAEIFWQDRRVLTLTVENFVFL